jgi:ABC-type oligopeptide transport system ATPase subunit
MLSVENLCYSYESAKKNTQTLKNISFQVEKGETFGLVGESGSGKTTLALLLVGLLKPSSGSISYKDCSFNKDIQMVFQDPYSSLNPRMTVEETITEPLIIHKVGNDQTRKNRTLELLDLVGLDPSFTKRYPHEMSGGQRQRVCISRALALNPKFLICDEPVSALDVSIQAQIIHLLKDLQKKLNLTYFFISHDLALMKYLANRVAVMYQGELVEINTSKNLFAHPSHQYTQTLLSSMPSALPGLQTQTLHLTEAKILALTGPTD